MLNASVNCLDRHLATRGDRTALIFEPDDPNGDAQRITYRELHARTCRLANALRNLGVRKGDRITIYLPMIPDAVVAMLACARIGAIHSVVFGGFAPQSIADRVADCGSKLIITADEGLRGGKRIALKANVDAALALPGTNSVETVLVVRHTGAAVAMQMPRDRWVDVVVEGQPDTCEPEPMNAEDPLFILYTSGSTGKPKGVLHTTGGYLVFASFTHERVFGLRDDDVFWCSADVGWITGHTYIVYGPLANGATVVVFEGVPNHPDHSRFWRVIDKHQVTIFYTAPTAIRALMREGDAPVKAASRKSLRLLGTVGEPINPEAWRWYHDVVGDARCPVVDTWWQTETGGALITPPIGIEAEAGQRDEALLRRAARRWWMPKATCSKAKRPATSCCWIPGPGRCARCTATINASSTPISARIPACTSPATAAGAMPTAITGSPAASTTSSTSAAIASARRKWKARWSRIAKVAEAAVVGFPHDIKGQGIYAYVTLVAGEAESDALRAELIAHVRHEIGPIATPDHLQWAPGLPKTRSGKIMRRILRKIAEDAPDQLGDTSTLADPSVVESLVSNRRGA